MTMSPTANRTARRNLVLRIDRFIRSIETGSQPAADQMANLRDALAALEQGTYSVGEDAMMLAERGWKPRRPPVSSPSTLTELVETFERLQVEE